MTRNDDHAFSRRWLLRSSAALSIAGVASTALAQEALPSEIELGGRVSSWVGQAPDAIADERNPTLRLEAGQEYTLTWENLDGAAHNFVIVDGNDERLLETDLVASSGETQTVEFTAEEGMVGYFCGPHRSSMNGEIELVGGDGGDGATTDDGPLIGEGPTVGLEPVADGFANPVTLETADEDADRRFIVDQTGTISVHGEDGLESEPFLDVSDRLVDLREGFDERGLLGLAFHPDFAENGRFFVRYSAPPREDTPEGYDHTFVLSEFQTADDDHASADPDSERTILEIPEPQFNHNAGPIAFGPDGFLYVATGDGGGANDSGEGHVEDWYDENEGGNGQDTEENLLGGILRLDVDGGTSETSRDGGGDAADEGEERDERAYGIPDDNPLVDMEGHRDEYYAWGLRNPWGMTLTSEGTILAADVGQELFEEVDHVERGGNYGWNVREGTHCFSTESPTEPPEECPRETPESVRGGEPLLDPVLEYPHEADGEPVGVSVIGGYLYEGEEVDPLAGTYVFGDWSRNGQSPGRLFVARPPTAWLEENATVETEEDDDNPFIDPPGEGDGDGEGDGGETESEDGLWPIEELEVETASEDDDDDRTEDDDGEPVAVDGDINRLVYGFGRDDAGELYVLTSATPSIEEDDGAVYRIVPQQRSEH